MNLLSVQNEWLLSFFLNFILIAIVQRYPLLTKSGWIHSGILGTILLACLGWPGWFVVSIYLVFGSLVTKVGFKYKKARGIAEGRDGRRGPENVWGSAATGAILAIIYNLFGDFGQPFIFLGFASSFSAKLADTFGSEIGKRWGKKTYLITTFKPVPSGTDGAISIEGTLASFLGSSLMAVVMFAFYFIPSLELLLIVVISSFIATLMESFFGALFQHRIPCLTNEVVNFIQTSFAAILSISLALML